MDFMIAIEKRPREAPTTLLATSLIAQILVGFFFLITPQKVKANEPNSFRWLGTHYGAIARANIACYAGLIYDGNKITTINRYDGVFRFDGEKWENTTDTYPDSQYRCMFIDSRGIIYVGGQRKSDGKAFIYESPDGLNFAAVQEITQARTYDAIWNFTEDCYGNVWAAEYITDFGPTDAHLWRRKPDGTWGKVMTWDGNNGTADERHVHWVYYCPYRDALYIAIGDLDHGILKLNGTRLNQDTYSAEDFKYIVPTDDNGYGVCVTAITSDAEYVYVAMDMHQPHTGADRAIARIRDDGVTQTIEYVYPLPTCILWTWAHSYAGYIVFSGQGSSYFWCGSGEYQNIIVASNDHGDSWTKVKDWGSPVGGLIYVGLPSYYYDNWSGIYAGGVGTTNTQKDGVLFAGRVVPANTTFYIDKTNGQDWTNFGISDDAPIKSLEWLSALDVQPGDTIQFIGEATYTDPLIVGWSGEEGNKIAIKGNSTSVLAGGSTATPPLFSENFEGPKDSWGFTISGDASSVLPETDIVREGLQSAKIVFGGSGVVYLRKTVSQYNIQEDDTLYISFEIYYPNDVPNGEAPIMFRILDDFKFEQRLTRYGNSSRFLTNEIVLWPDVYKYFSTIGSEKALSSGQWHNIEIEMLCHPTKGNIKLRVDNELQIMINGIKTQTSGSTISDLYFLQYQYPVTYYIDAFKVGIAPFNDRAALTINDHDYLDISNLKFQSTTGADLSRGTVTLRLSHAQHTLLGDLDLNGIIDFKDFAKLASEWLETEGWYQGP